MMEDYTTCYWRNGTVADGFEPCHNDQYSMCMDRRYDSNDICQSNGLIWNPYPTRDEPWGSFWRTTCTDQTWTSPMCISVCSTTTESSNTLYPCDDDKSIAEIQSLVQQGDAVEVSEKWCCHDAGCDCSRGGGVPLLALDVSTASSATTSSTATSSTMMSSIATPSTTTTTSSSPTATLVAPTNNSSSLGVPLGVGLGVGLTAIGVILGGLWWFMRRKKRVSKAGTSESDTKPELYGESIKGAIWDVKSEESHQHAQLSAGKTDAPHVEIDGREIPVEASEHRPV